MLIVRILRRLGVIKKRDPLASLKNVTIGSNTEITGSIVKDRGPDSKLIIGKDCLICGHICLETNDAVVEIGDNVFIGPNTSIVCIKSIKIGSDILISADCLIQDSDNHSLDFEIRKRDTADWKKGFHDWSKHPSIPIQIGHGAWIGAKAIILKGVYIGEKSIVGAGSVVTKSVEPYKVVAGNPARVIKDISDFKA
jgi:acetyltransferase-like isoleucine patch superfamily enzyme